MSIYENLTRFAGRPVADYDANEGLSDPTETAYRVRIDYDASEAGTQLTDVLARLLAEPKAPALKALVIGAWNFDSSLDSGSIVQMLARAGDRLAGLEHLFLGDIISEEQEISWIQQSDISPLFAALPRLRTLRVRGSDKLEVGAVRHEHLEELAFESGGLP